MLNKMSAEVCFCNPEDLAAAKSKLIEAGFEVRELDWIDPMGGPHVWVMVEADTELDASLYLDRVSALVELFDGNVIEAGPSSLMPSAA